MRPSGSAMSLRCACYGDRLRQSGSGVNVFVPTLRALSKRSGPTTTVVLTSCSGMWSAYTSALSSGRSQTCRSLAGSEVVDGSSYPHGLVLLRDPGYLVPDSEPYRCLRGGPWKLGVSLPKRGHCGACYGRRRSLRWPSGPSHSTTAMCRHQRAHRTERMTVGRTRWPHRTRFGGTGRKSGVTWPVVAVLTG